MQTATLVLRDIHQPPAPSWWPPAPGWWLVAAAALITLAVWMWFVRRQQRRHRIIAAIFDDAVAEATSPSAEVATMSELLRRAARRRDRNADRLQGDAWLAFLDAGDKQHRFSQGNGRLLLEGGFRRDVDPHKVAALRMLARARFLEWMAAK